MKTLFKTAALAHQIQYFQKFHNITLKHSNRGFLYNEHAHAYYNFYTAMFGMKTILGTYFKTNKHKSLYKQVLNSKQIAINFFGPLKNMLDETGAVILLRKLTGHNIVNFTEFHFDYPSADIPYYNGKACLDVYMQANTKEERKLGIGVKVFYAEDHSTTGFWKYNPFSGQGDDSNSSIRRLLPEDLKCTWPSYDFGNSMIEHNAVDEFVFIHLYPSGNSYQHALAHSCRMCLFSLYDCQYLPLSYEDLIKDMRLYLTRENKEVVKWIDYLYERYIPAQAHIEKQRKS